MQKLIEASKASKRLFVLCLKRNGVKSLDILMATKAFTYSRLPEHQVAVYYDGSDKAGVVVGRCEFIRIFEATKSYSNLMAFSYLCFLGKPSEWNIVECFVSFCSSILLLATFPISLFFCLKVSFNFTCKHDDTLQCTF